jgi:hypothetical protein
MSQQYTSCEEYGHQYELDGDQLNNCLSCGEERN